MKTNAFFENLDRIAREYEKRHDAHKELKQQILDTKGWDSEELKAWYKEEKEQFQYPISRGACKAFRDWRNSETDEVIVDEFCWDQDRHDFIDALRKAGIQTFVTTDHSTGLMDDLHGFVAEGCELIGLCTITKKDNLWGIEKEEQIPGIRFRIC